ncbi:MAG: DUF4158 domain-containing protein [Tardiphaga sp.]|nr:DUF4158 domain-containing protein [Tardiphaga sp.]
MARRTLLTGDERQRLFDPPVTDRELARDYTLSPDVLEWIDARHGPSNQQVAAVQKAPLRHPGFGWRAGEVVAFAVLRFLADQVHVPPSAVGDYANWPQTRIEHTTQLHSGRGSRRRHQSRPGTHGQCKTRRHLRSTRLTQSWHLSEENYRAALARIIEVHHAQPFARQWGRRPSLRLGRTLLSIRPSPERGGRDQRQVRTPARLANLHPHVGQARLVQHARALGHVVGGALCPRWTCGPTGRRALRRHRRRHRPRVRAVSSPGLPVRAAFPGSARSPLRHHRAKAPSHDP